MNSRPHWKGWFLFANDRFSAIATLMMRTTFANPVNRCLPARYGSSHVACLPVQPDQILRSTKTVIGMRVSRPLRRVKVARSRPWPRIRHRHVAAFIPCSIMLHDHRIMHKSQFFVEMDGCRAFAIGEQVKRIGPQRPCTGNHGVQ